MRESIDGLNKSRTDKELARKIAIKTDRYRTAEAVYNKQAHPPALKDKIYGFLNGSIKKNKAEARGQAQKAMYAERELETVNSVQKEVQGFTMEQIRVLSDVAQREFFKINKEFNEFKGNKSGDDFLDIQKRRDLAFFRFDQLNAIVIQHMNDVEVKKRIQKEWEELKSEVESHYDFSFSRLHEINNVQFLKSILDFLLDWGDDVKQNFRGSDLGFQFAQHYIEAIKNRLNELN